MSHEVCPEKNEACPWFGKDMGCHSSIHHLYWPRIDYTSTLERTFRNLPENKVQTCRDEHDEIHANLPPLKPSPEVMRYAIEEADVFLSVTKRRKIGL